jgi:fatty-acyl-CoA synthase
VRAVNPTELTPLSFLDRSAIVWPNETAILYGDREINYAEMAGNATRLGHALPLQASSKATVSHICARTHPRC